jgi:hypothetical protein
MALLVRVSAADLSERWFEDWQPFGKPIVFAEKRVPVFSVTLLYLLKRPGFYWDGDIFLVLGGSAPGGDLVSLPG